MKSIFAFIVWGIFACIVPAFACSICAYSIDGRAYFCGNEDWSATDPAMLSAPASKDSYGYLILGWASYLPGYAQAGINSEGLCFDWAMVPAQRYASKPGRAQLSIDFPVEALRKCKDVGELLRFIEGKDIPHVAEEHLMFADKSGRSCVIEYSKGELRVIEGSGGAQYVTNFALSDPTLGGYPCARYSRMEAFFKAEGDKSPALASLLDSVHQEGGYQTIYSYVFDLAAGKVTLYYKHDFRNPKAYSLAALVSRAALTRIAP
jgi:choloylglycine hydrolase